MFIIRSVLHVILTAVVVSVLWWMFDAINLTSIIPAIYLTFATDISADPEAGPMSYKMYLTHSTIIWIIIFLFNPIALTALMMLSLSLHCLTDIYPGSPDLPRKNYNSWLFTNGTVGIIFFLLYIIAIL